jgi:hypothetical protein
MNIYLLNVINAETNSNPSPSPSLCFNGQWLSKIGFVPGALVKAIPKLGGMEFILCDEYISSYSELVASTRKQGGKLLQVCCNRPALETNGQLLHNAGINCGDALIARYDYGLIQARKLPAMAKVIIVTSVKNQDTGNLDPKVWLVGNWLSEFGFAPEIPVVSISEPGKISFGIIEKYSDLCFSSQSKMKLIQVHKTRDWGKRYPYMRAPNSCLNNAGFTIGDVLFAYCEHGIITLRKLDFEGLGF